jgi:hypothetical protein
VHWALVLTIKKRQNNVSNIIFFIVYIFYDF